MIPGYWELDDDPATLIAQPNSPPSVTQQATAPPSPTAPGGGGGVDYGPRPPHIGDPWW